MSPGTILTSPKSLRAAFQRNPSAAPCLPISGLRVGELVRLTNSSTEEYIVLDETRIERQVGPDECAIGLFGGKDNATSFRTVLVGRIKGKIYKPKTSFGRGDK